MRPLLVLMAILLAACQPATTPQEQEVAIQEQTEPTFDVEACRGLGSFAIAIADGRRSGITRTEALDSAIAGPLTPLFRTIVTGVYDAPRPTTAAEWEELRRVYAILTTRGCIQAATGEAADVRTSR